MAHLHTCEIMVFWESLVQAKKECALAVVSRYHNIPNIIAMPWTSPQHHSEHILMLLKAIPDGSAMGPSVYHCMS